MAKSKGGGRSPGGNYFTNTVRPGAYPDGTPRHGVPAKGYGPQKRSDLAASATGSTTTSGTRYQAVGNNPRVHSTGAANGARNGFRPSDPHNGDGKLHGFGLPTPVKPRLGYALGKSVSEQAGYATDGSGRWLGASQPATGKATEV